MINFYMLNIVKLKLNNLNKNTLYNEGDYRGVTRHYPPASQEWLDSTYTFNKNTLILLPASNNLVIKLIRSYFNMFNRKLENEIIKHDICISKTRLTLPKILISKPNIKHTNDKVIITLYIYNREYSYFLKKINKIFKRTFAYIRRFFLYKLKHRGRLRRLIWLKWMSKGIENLINKSRLRFKWIWNNNEYLELILIKIQKIFKLRVNKRISIRSIILNKIIEEDLCTDRLKINFNNLSNNETGLFNRFMGIFLRKEMLYMYFKQMIFINKFKFKNTYILPLKILIEKIYGKKVEFNLVTLKYYYLNSDILVQAITLKTNNRKNRVLKVIKASLRRIHILYLNKSLIMREPTKFIGVQNLIVKNLILKNKKVNYLSNISLNNNYDYLNIILNKNFNNIKIENSIYNSIKNKDINGIRVEASGRLTRRIKASKAIFKFRYVGTLKNIDSSYKGLSSVILKGGQKTNLQYSELNSKTIIGAFGIKGWVSGF